MLPGRKQLSSEELLTHHPLLFILPLKKMLCAILGDLLKSLPAPTWGFTVFRTQKGLHEQRLFIYLS